VQAISVCTPNVLHAEMTIAASSRGIHVLVEKPMAVTLAEARAMIEAGRQSGALLMVGQTQRYFPQHRQAFQIVQSGALGRIFQVRTTFGHAGPLDWSPRGRWFITARLAGTGVIGDLGVHKADLLRYLTGQEVERVAAFKAAFELEELEDNAVAVLQLSGGALATLSASWTTRGGSFDDFVLVGEGGSLRVGVEPGAPLVLYRASGGRVVYSLPEEAALAEVAEFVQAVLGARPNPLPGEEGYRALEICVAIDRSARTGKIVRLPL
jgi:predicted dehydrogenase